MNGEIALIGYFLATVITAGLLGTGAMTLFMWFLTRAGFTNADMVRAIGSMITKSMENALLVGAVAHVISGIFWATAYTLVFNLIGLHGLWAQLGVGMGMGLAHGFILSFILVSSVAEHHPLPEFREAGISVAMAHFAGHGVFGAVVGFVVGMSGFTAT